MLHLRGRGQGGGWQQPACGRPQRMPTGALKQTRSRGGLPIQANTRVFIWPPPSPAHLAAACVLVIPPAAARGDGLAGAAAVTGVAPLGSSWVKPKMFPNTT